MGSTHITLMGVVLFVIGVVIFWRSARKEAPPELATEYAPEQSPAPMPEGVLPIDAKSIKELYVKGACLKDRVFRIRAPRHSPNAGIIVSNPGYKCLTFTVSTLRPTEVGRVLHVCVSGVDKLGGQLTNVNETLSAYATKTYTADVSGIEAVCLSVWDSRGDTCCDVYKAYFHD